MKRIKRFYEKMCFAYEMQSTDAKLSIIVITAITATFIVWLLTMIYYGL